MQYEIDWFIRYRVIQENIRGNPTTREIQQHFEACERLLSEAAEAAPDNMVHLLIDALEAESVPPIYKMIQPGAKLLGYKNRGRALLMTRNPKVSAVYEITSRLGGERYVLHIFREREAALEFLDGLMTQEDNARQGGR